MTRSFTKKTIPKLLYKYRDWSKKLHRRLITHNEIYFSKPSSFNDPFDGNIPVRWDLLTYEDCLEKNLEFVKISNKTNDPKIQRQVAEALTESKSLWHPKNVNKESPEDIMKWDDIIGLISLSEERDNILMWSHYANFHHGFVVGLYSESILNNYDFDYLDHINYSYDYPIISGNDDHTEQFLKKFFSKSKMWEYEKEWRITKNHIKKRLVKLNKETFGEFIIGCQVSDSDKNLMIKSITKKFGSDVKIFIASKGTDTFSLEIKEI